MYNLCQYCVANIIILCYNETEIYILISYELLKYFSMGMNTKKHHFCMCEVYVYCATFMNSFLHFYIE